MTITNKELTRKRDRERGKAYLEEADATPLQIPRKKALQEFAEHLIALEKVGVKSSKFGVAHLQKLIGTHYTSRKEDE